MRAELQRLSQKLGVTSIYVTHDQIEAMTLGHRIAIIDKGVLQQVGEPEQVYLEPINKFVAGFIGSPAMNFLEGKVMQNENSLYFESDTLKYKIPERYHSLSNYVNKDVILGIRPEHIYLNSNTDEKNNYEVKIGVAEPIGSDTFIYIDFPDQSTMIVKLEGLQKLRVDEEINVTFDEEQIHFFEKESELRIKSI